MAMSDTVTMQCMEVWGGNQPVDCGVVMAGLDAWVYSKPHGGAGAGGDVHYVSSCATGRITRLLLADVSGHGDGVSNTAVKLRNLMRRFVNYIDQTRFVRSMNEEFATLGATGCFATAVITTYYAPTNELAICNAGHPPPFVFRGATGQWVELEPGTSGKAARKAAAPPAATRAIANTPLGIIDIAQYEQFATRVGVGDMVFCYTDALIECRDAAGNMLGVSGLLEIVKRLDASEPTKFIGTLLEALRALNPANLSEDDVTALLYRVNGLAPRLTMGEKVRTAKLWFKTILGALRPGRGPFPWPELSLPNIGGAVFNRLSKAKSSPSAES